MTYFNYRNMTKAQSEAAFREYLDERGPALERLSLGPRDTGDPLESLPRAKGPVRVHAL